MVERRTLSADITALTEYLTAQPDVIVAYLFGSRATGRARAASDVDVAALLNEEDSFARFERRLQLMVEVSDVCGREADVIVLNDAPPLLQHQVLRHGRLLYERDRRARIEFEIRAGKVYADLEPMRRFFRQALFREVKEVGLGGRR
jgi:predicted nucleotidyltransferase